MTHLCLIPSTFILCKDRGGVGIVGNDTNTCFNLTHESRRCATVRSYPVMVVWIDKKTVVLCIPIFREIRGVCKIWTIRNPKLVSLGLSKKASPVCFRAAIYQNSIIMTVCSFTIIESSQYYSPCWNRNGRLQFVALSYDLLPRRSIVFEKIWLVQYVCNKVWVTFAKKW